MEFCRNLLALLLVMVCMGASTRGNGLVRVKADLCSGTQCRPWQQCVADQNGQGEPRCGCETQCAVSKSQNREVCASDDETYPSKCEMRKAACMKEMRLRVVSKGRCLSDPCLSIVCGRGRVCIPDPADSSQPKCVCNHKCSASQVDYVCGSNNLTYQTPCHLHKAACETRAEISIQHQGVCALPPGLGGMSPVPTTAAPEDHVRLFNCSMCSSYTHCDEDVGACLCARCDHVTQSPVCGSDLQTYLSACHLYRDACVHKRHTTLAYAGYCKDPFHELTEPCRNVQCQYGAVCEERGDRGICVCPTFCPNYEDPVCGTDGMTYHNRCFMKRTECLEHTEINVASDGPCPTPPATATPTSRFPADPCQDITCPGQQECKIADGQAFCACFTACPTDVETVCGTDGLTYLNPCALQSIACVRNISITIRHQGECRGNPCAGVTCPRFGRCVVEDGLGTCSCERNCSATKSVVCGSNGRLYRNLCMLKQLSCQTGESVTPIDKQQCLALVNSETSTTPSGVTVAQDPCAGVTCHFHGQCVVQPSTGLATCNCDRNCSDVTEPVCGLNGGLHIYQSRCIMEKVACQLSEDIEIVDMARCTPHSSSPTASVTSATVHTTMQVPGTTTESCPVCTTNSPLTQSFPRSCNAQIVASGRLNTSVAKIEGESVEYSFQVARYMKAPKIAGKNLSLKKVKVRFLSSCTCSNPPSMLILAGEWVGDANSLDGHILVDYNANGVLEPYRKKPWKLWRGMYNYGRELKQMICRQQR